MSTAPEPQRKHGLLALAPALGKTIADTLGPAENEAKKRAETPPSWVRLVSGALGFFSSLLTLSIPAIVLLIMDRIIPADNTTSLWQLLGLGFGTVLSVCLIDLMRMRALERYFTNVRGLVLYQDACFGLFWLFVMAFLHPLIPLVSLGTAAMLIGLWAMRKNRKIHGAGYSRTQDMDPVLVDAVGLGPAYLQKSSIGEIEAEEQPDFQTVGQSTLLNLIQMISTLVIVSLTAWLHISGRISIGTMIATVFLNQIITSVFIRFFQVQALKPVRPDLSALGLGEITPQVTVPNTSPRPQAEDMVMLEIQKIEDFGFAPFSADLFQGLCLTLIGPSGSGKSEILRAIATGQFYEGKITYRGRNWGRNHGRLHSASYVSPTPISLKGTIVENVTCFDPKATPLKAIELLRKLDPYEDVFRDMDFVNTPIDENFSAQGQIVSLARAFWQDPEIIILDTPETYLDKASRSALMALILKAKTEGKIVIMATDDDYLMSVADEVVKLERGEVTDRGPMTEVLSRHHQRWVRVSFLPTKREAFRLSLWLEAQFPLGMPEELRERVKQAAQDMLFLAPRDAIIDRNEEVLFDVRMTPNEVAITMHDKGDLVLSDQLEGALKLDYARVEEATDGFEQTLREGYRQFAVRFAADRSASAEPLLDSA